MPKILSIPQFRSLMDFSKCSKTLQRNRYFFPIFKKAVFFPTLTYFVSFLKIESQG